MELTTLASGSDILTLGMRADDARRARHGRQTTFVRVADIAVQTGAPAMWPAATGEIRIVGAPADRSAAIARVKEVAALLPPGNDRPPLSGFSLADLEWMVMPPLLTGQCSVAEAKMQPDGPGTAAVMSRFWSAGSLLDKPPHPWPIGNGSQH